MKFIFKHLQAIAHLNNLNTRNHQLLRSSVWFSSSILLTLLTSQATFLFMHEPAKAEGSKELVSKGGSRPYLEWSAGTTANIPRKTLLKVYVQSGEIINLGSSVHTSFDSKDIVLRTPSGIESICDVKIVAEGGAGFIDTLAKEAAGPLPNVGGYTPCQFTATQTGIYEVEFHAPATSGDPPAQNVNIAFPTGNTQRMAVSAWDITVRDTQGNTKTGRVFTNYVAMNMGNTNRSLNSAFYIQTKDGFRYRTEMNGVDPFAFIFFGNSRGFIDKTDNSTLYHSARAADGDNTLSPFLGNIEVQRPDVPDTPTDITHLVFFNRPDPNTLIHLGIPTTPIIPSIPTNFKFTGGNGGSGNQTYVGVGGKFSFDSTSNGSYEIIIDTNNDGVYNPSQDRVLQNIANVGSNVVVWDGKDRNGVNLNPLPGNAPYNTKVTLRTGEYHFPMLDAENNPNGFVIEMENPPAPFPSGVNTYTVYYNDDNYTAKNGTSIDLGTFGTPTNPRNAATGIDSSPGVHRFSGNYGDFKGIDTWAYFPSEPVITPLVITNNQRANVQGKKSVAFLTDNDNSNTVTVGDTVEYTITYSNLAPGNSNAINFVINDSLPSQINFVAAQITSQTSGNNITLNSGYSGSGALTNLGTLRVGDTITIKITATINNANNGNPISNQAIATFNTPDNLATTGTVLTDADSAGASNNPPTVGNSFFQVDNAEDIGNDPGNAADDDPTLFTVETIPVVNGTPKILLVKRITAINAVQLTQLVDDNNSTDDNNSQWLANFLTGAINGGLVRPQDELEYTIYYLSAGDATAKNVLICDRIPNHVTFIPTAFNNYPDKAPGNVGDRGILWQYNGQVESLTNYDINGKMRYLPPGVEPQTIYFDPNNPSKKLVDCGQPNTNGAIIIDLGDVPNAQTPGTPTNSYGFIRFRGRVK
ncbi:isopeptide-forming domain-containing fimbrial protein [Calothrix sp. UHCC 0171]|uniref:isopeptide-forming domain-containing fimbrial protein n=1 Tax=Calothrix sp. UHCC 0171 TaxID=3110245 RepID=UPI002B1F64A2|nr:isopeptide-forming domain-containing fimbrial protein [Calothrix sp. UHCC 0171]MEA5572537.1 isopeptide-forming domain-containing fimbrial protein [Calothrix sp. UHCC 0171]